MSDHIVDADKMVSVPESVIDRVLFEQGYDRTEGTSRGILSALSAAGWVVEQGWRTMETAPRDGTRFIAWFPPCVQLPAGGWHECQWHNGAWYHPFFVEPMLWRPGPSLPAAPEARDDGR